MASLLRHLAARHAGFVLASAALLGGFQYLMCAAVGSVNVAGAIETALASLPPVVQAAVNSQLFGGVTSGGLVAFGWTHPIAQAAGTAVAIVLAARAIAGEAESGTIELTLAQPLSRGAYFAAHAIHAALALLVVSVLGVAGSAIGQRLFHIPCHPTGQWLRLGVNFWLLQCAWFGVTLLLSSFAREGGRAASAGFLLALASYVAFVIGSLWDRAAFVLPYALHDYFEPRAILQGGAGIGHAALVLGIVTLATTGAAWLQFRRRDLP